PTQNQLAASDCWYPLLAHEIRIPRAEWRLRSRSASSHQPGCSKFVTEAKVERQTRRDLPVILKKAVNRVLVAVENSGTRSAQGPVKPIGDLIVDECLKVGVVPFAT